MLLCIGRVVMNKAKLNKYIEFGTTKVKILYKEKTFKTNDCNLKYILEKQNNNNKLVVIFSGIPRPGVKARYNYMRTLKNIKANKLFILDDFGYDQRGAYYLGKDKQFEVEKATKKLIATVKNNLDIDKTFYVGSSKGGYAALFYGVQDNESFIIAGSLQYLLGNYITSNERRTENIMKWVMGNDYSKNDVDFLNNLLKNVLIEHKETKCEIHLHYSDKEYTYNDHMKHLLNDMKNLGISYFQNVENYKKHEDIAYYFPEFLINTLNRRL